MTSPQSNSLHGKGRECVITRRACFSSSHRYWLPEKSPEENLSLFGKCSFAPGHGHNYEIRVNIFEQPIPTTTFINLKTS